MHMADALVSAAVGGTMYVASASAAAYSLKKIKKEDNPKAIPVMGVMGAFVFATQMINFTIPGTGSSGHLCGGMLLSAILGPYAGFITMIGVLLVQGLLFADGGLLALGCNVWNMAFYGCFIGSMLIWAPVMRCKTNKIRITLAAIVGCVITLQLGAFSVVLETVASQVTELPFEAFVITMQPIHLAIGLVEGLITAAVLCFIYEERPQMLWNTAVSSEENNKTELKTMLFILLVSALAIGGGLSYIASSNPDGLEWSIEKVTGNTEITANDAAHDMAGQLQEKTAVLPDYDFAKGDSVAGNGFSGITGAVVILTIAMGSGYIYKKRRKLKPDITNEQTE